MLHFEVGQCRFAIAAVNLEDDEAGTCAHDDSEIGVRPHQPPRANLLCVGRRAQLDVLGTVMVPDVAAQLATAGTPCVGRGVQGEDGPPVLRIVQCRLCNRDVDHARSHLFDAWYGRQKIGGVEFRPPSGAVTRAQCGYTAANRSLPQCIMSLAVPEPCQKTAQAAWTSGVNPYPRRILPRRRGDSGGRHLVLRSGAVNHVALKVFREDAPRPTYRNRWERPIGHQLIHLAP